MTTPGAQPLGMSDFFALEAGEYLDRLDGLLNGEGAPAADELVRLARALRGSALMASQQAIARAAMGLEALARGMREGRRPWDPAVKQIAVRAVDDLRIFVRRAAQWTEADTAKAEALGSQLEQLGGRSSGASQARAAEAIGLDAGARAFVAREGAAIASALDRAARALRGNPLAHDPLQQVLKALQPLRGLAALNDLPPLPDLLEGIEGAIAELGRTTAAAASGDDIGELLQMAATSIAHAAREVAERGRPDPESAEFRKFAGLLMRLMERSPEVVSIEALGGTIVQRGTPRTTEDGPASLGRLELVSHGEHLRQAADSLERAPSATQRELRAHTLAGTFRALGAAGGGIVGERVAEFAQAAREAVTRGVAVNAPAVFATELRRAGEILSASSTGDETASAAALAAVTAALRALGTPAAAAEPPVVPIDTLAPRAPRDAPDPQSGDLAGSWTAYQQMVAAGVGPASLEALIAGTSPANGGPADPAVVDINQLLYRGARARQRAQELRDAAKRASGDDLRAIIDEVCDLVVLAIEPE